MAEYLQNSFIGGEISDKLLGRTDLETYFRGAKKIENMIVSLSGGVISRAGFKYLNEIDEGEGTPRLFNYVYSEDIAFVVVMRGNKLWVFDLDGNIEYGPITTEYNDTSVWKIKYAQNGKFLYFVDGNLPTSGVNKPVYKLVYDGSTFSFLKVMFESTGLLGMGLSISASKSSGHVSERTYRYKVCAMNSNTGFVSMPLKGNGTADSDYAVITACSNTLSTSVYNIISMTFSALSGIIVTCSVNTAGTGYTIGDILTIGTGVGGTVIVSGVSTGGVVTGVTLLTGGSGYSVTDPSAPYTTTGGTGSGCKINVLTITSKTLAEARSAFMELYDSYLIFKEETHTNNNTYRMSGAYVKINGLADSTVFNDYGTTNTTELVPSPFVDFSSTKGYPSSISFMQDRLIVASTPQYPLSIYLSAVGAYEDLTYRFATGNGRGLMLTMATQQKDSVKFIIDSGKTILMTDSGIYRFGTYQDSAISYDNIPTLKRQYNFGVCDVQPQIIGNRIIFINRSMKEIRDLVYDYQSDSFNGNELSYFVPQLIGDYKIIDSVYQHHPYRTIWYIREDGMLLGMSYSSELKIFSWHRHYCGGGGLFKSITSVPNNREDDLFSIIEHVDKDNNTRYYLTKMLADVFSTNDVKKSHYLDLSVVVDSETKVDTITGLDHLDGLQVSILADGNYLGEFYPYEGSITLQNSYNYIVAGLKYNKELETLDLNIPSKNIMFRNKNIHTVHVKTEKSRTYKIGDYSTSLKYEYYDIAPDFNIGDNATNSIKVSNNWNKPSNISIISDTPLPLNISCIELEFSLGGK